jgi:nitrite reductase/ring-hydroxylating ferredoxin subunit
MKETAASHPADETLVLLCAASEVPSSGGKRIELEKRPPLAVFRLGDEFVVIDDLCTHAGGSMSEGEVVGDSIFCPTHAGEFELRTGKALGFPATEDLQTYRTVVFEGNVFADLEKAAP